MLTLSSTSDLASVRQRIANIEQKLEPITKDAAIDAIGVMIKAFGAAAGADDPALARLYLRATLVDPMGPADGPRLPHGAVESLCHEIGFGLIEGLSRDFPPKVPQFADLARKRAEGLRVMLRNRRRELTPVPAPEARPKIAAPSLTDHMAELARDRERLAKDRERREARVNADIAKRRAERETTVVFTDEAELPSDVEP